MQKLKETFLKIVKTRPGLFASMIALLVLALALFVFALFRLSPSDLAVSVGYGDLDGYRTGVWTERIAFAVLALIFGILHNVIAVRLYAKRGNDLARAFIWLSIGLVFVTFVVLLRVSGVA